MWPSCPPPRDIFIPSQGQGEGIIRFNGRTKISFPVRHRLCTCARLTKTTCRFVRIFSFSLTHTSTVALFSLCGTRRLFLLFRSVLVAALPAQLSERVEERRRCTKRRRGGERARLRSLCCVNDDLFAAKCRERSADRIHDYFHSSALK